MLCIFKKQYLQEGIAPQKRLCIYSTSMMEGQPLPTNVYTIGRIITFKKGNCE